MDANDIVKQIQDYFGDTSRPARDTLEGLRLIAEEAEAYANTIDAEADSEESDK